MNKSNERNNTLKNIWSSFLAGFGSAVLGFFAGTVLSGVLIFIFFSIFGTFTEVGPLMVMYVSPIIGVVTAVFLGIRSGIKIYKSSSASNNQ
ncbi:MAG TPA: hypothetical protein PLT08_14570 [Anaerolineales bacterium]|nr:hypothetical protein [Anaerolineales bacterium]